MKFVSRNILKIYKLSHNEELICKVLDIVSHARMARPLTSFYPSHLISTRLVLSSKAGVSGHPFHHQCKDYPRQSQIN